MGQGGRLYYRPLWNMEHVSLFSMAKQQVFTINNPQLSPDEFLSKFEGLAQYVVFQEEKAPETGTIHYQGYVEFKKKKRYSWCSKHLAKGHWEARSKNSTREAARDYCKKRDTRTRGPWELGQWLDQGQGKRTDIDRVVELAKKGHSYHEIARQEPKTALRYPKGVQLLAEAHQSQRTGTVEVHLIHDDPGTGKSSYLANKFGAEAYWKPPGKWWNGYNGQKVIILDEYRGWLAMADLLFTLRPIGFRTMETKGGQGPLAHTQVWITTNIHPRNWHDYTTKSCMEGYEAIETRVNHVYRMQDYEPLEIDHKVYFQ